MRTILGLTPPVSHSSLSRLAGLLLAGAGTLLSGCAAHDAAPTPLAAATGTADLTAGLGNGVNLQPSYYNGGNPNFGFSLMKQQSKIKTVRIEIEPGYETQAKGWISQAKSNGFAVIATYHKSSVLGSDNTGELATAGNWWKANYKTLGGNFTINLMNEWGSHNISSNTYAAAYNSAISSVRSVYSGPIIIDIPGYGQETATAAAAVKGTGGTKINDTNIILSAHVYPNGYNQGKGHTLQNADLDDLGSAGRPCIIGEFGNSPSGAANWSGIVSYAKSKGWTVLGWCWNGDGGSMNMVTPSWSSNATATSFSLSSYFNTVYNLL
ncbi:cellulase family glycosylhydrolase [Hymenobacter psoromatis]|uniref:cellulase family glycosylhydrolase n=1 Tax=Hymenobacter psoromatis TaxID=1484116 RepID=UPI001CC086F2|nr:cellulase family glycosylhydrolase [Hymenobacter psoromatis]